MLNQFSRTQLLIKKEGINKLQNAKIVIFGIGGVGSYVVEGLVRSGVENFVLVDNDKISLTNLNRQIIATMKTIGKYKVDVMKQRIIDINPNACVKTYKEFFLPNSESNIINKDISYVIDCVDTVTAKIEIIAQAKKNNIPVISSMGTGNKLDPSKFEITDIYKTDTCPLAKVMRKELKKREIKNVKVIFSREQPIEIERQTKISNLNGIDNEFSTKMQVPGSISFVPSVAGLMIAGEVIRDIIR